VSLARDRDLSEARFAERGYILIGLSSRFGDAVSTKIDEGGALEEKKGRSIKFGQIPQIPYRGEAFSRQKG